jgi:phage gp46-like protein
MAQGTSGTAQISGYFNSILEDALFVARDSMIMPSLVTQYSAVGWADRKLSIYPQISATAVAETSDYANPTSFTKSAQATLTPSEIMAQVILTDRRAEDSDVLPDGATDRRGWWGDSVAPAEEQSGHVLGSRLWTLSRATLDDNTAVLANDIVRTALQPIVDQGAVARFDVETSSNYQSPAGNGTGILAIGIRGYGRDGALSYDQRFEVLWEQIKNMRR